MTRARLDRRPPRASREQSALRVALPLSRKALQSCSCSGELRETLCFEPAQRPALPSFSPLDSQSSRPASEEEPTFLLVPLNFRKKREPARAQLRHDPQAAGSPRRSHPGAPRSRPNLEWTKGHVQKRERDLPVKHARETGAGFAAAAHGRRAAENALRHLSPRRDVFANIRIEVASNLAMRRHLTGDPAMWFKRSSACPVAFQHRSCPTRGDWRRDQDT